MSSSFDWDKTNRYQRLAKQGAINSTEGFPRPKGAVDESLPYFGPKFARPNDGYATPQEQAEAFRLNLARTHREEARVNFLRNCAEAYVGRGPLPDPKEVIAHDFQNEIGEAGSLVRWLRTQDDFWFFVKVFRCPHSG